MLYYSAGKNATAMVFIGGDRGYPAVRFEYKTIGRISSITSYKDHCSSFFTSWVIKQQKSCILNILEKTPNFGRTVHTLDNTLSLKIKFSEAYT